MRRGGLGGRSRAHAVTARGKGRAGRNLNEAAEALLGMCVEMEEEPPQASPCCIQEPLLSSENKTQIIQYNKHSVGRVPQNCPLIGLEARLPYRAKVWLT